MTTKEKILSYVLENTYRPNMEDVSTNQISQEIGITTKEAYNILNQLSAEGKITKLEPTNGDNFSCCGWINNE